MRLLVFQLTHKCNQRCRFCCNKQGSFGKDIEIPFSKYLPLLNFFKRSGGPSRKEIALVGFGETLLYGQIRSFLEYLGSCDDCSRSLTTNGLLLNKYAKEVAGAVDRLHVSIHGLGKTHNKITGRNSFSQVIAGIKKVRCLNPRIALAINTVPCRENYRGLVKLVKYFSGYGNLKHCFMHLQSTKESHPADDFNPEMVEELFDIIHQAKKINPSIEHAPGISEESFKKYFYVRNVQSEKNRQNQGSAIKFACRAVESDALLVRSEGVIQLGCIDLCNLCNGAIRETDIETIIKRSKERLRIRIGDSAVQREKCSKCCDFKVLPLKN